MASLSLNDLWYRWLQSVLPAGVVNGTSQVTSGSGLVNYTEESVTAYGSVTGNNTSANAVIATIAAGSLPAGKYKVEVYHFVSAAVSPALPDNAELRKGATVVAKIQHQAAVMNSAAYGYGPKMTVVMNLNGSTAISVNFTANFGAAETQTHNVQIVATRIG